MSTDHPGDANTGADGTPVAKATTAAAVPAKKKGSLAYKILLVVTVLIVVFLAAAAMQPESFKIERSATIAAPPEIVFAQVNDFHKWKEWSPWAKLDPKMTQKFEGSMTGKGAIYSWDGNNEVGEGTMTIEESRPNELIHIKLEFKRPFKATNAADFGFKQEGNQTVITWTMTGKNDFLGKIFSLIMNMDKMVGAQFEQGLGKIKEISEAEAKKKVGG